MLAKDATVLNTAPRQLTIFLILLKLTFHSHQKYREFPLSPSTYQISAIKKYNVQAFIPRAQSSMGYKCLLDYAAITEAAVHGDCIERGGTCRRVIIPLWLKPCLIMLFF